MDFPKLPEGCRITNFFFQQHCTHKHAGVDKFHFGRPISFSVRDFEKTKFASVLPYGTYSVFPNIKYPSGDVRRGTWCYVIRTEKIEGFGSGAEVIKKRIHNYPVRKKIKRTNKKRNRWSARSWCKPQPI